MQQIPEEVTLARQVFGLLWLLVFTAILIAARWHLPAREFRDRTLQRWKPALVIALLLTFSALLGGFGFFFLSTVAIFIQAMLGLALSYEIPGFEPLPVSRAILRREGWAGQIKAMLVMSVGIVLVMLLVSVGGSVLANVFAETRTSQGVSAYLPDLGRSFLILLAGAGISEETTYRLVLVPLLLRLTRRPGLAILLSALVFGVYHLSPLDALYRSYWQTPLSTFTVVTFMGIFMGYVFLKQGYETVVLGHTLADWVGVVLTRAM